MTYRCALITGASSGIGEAFARVLPKSTVLLLTGRNRARLAHLAASWLPWTGRAQHRRRSRNGGGAAGGDRLRRRAADRPPDQQCRHRLPGSGRGKPAGARIEMAQLNMVAPVEITRALLPGMLKRAGSGGRGGIIFVASAAAFMPIPCSRPMPPARHSSCTMPRPWRRSCPTPRSTCWRCAPARPGRGSSSAPTSPAPTCPRCTSPTGWPAKGCTLWGTGLSMSWVREPICDGRRPAPAPPFLSPPRPSGRCDVGSNTEFC